MRPKYITKLSEVPEYIRKGNKVNYHAVIGGPVTQEGVTVCTDPRPLGDEYRNLTSAIVVWLEEKAGCVSVDALSKYTDPVEKKHNIGLIYTTFGHYVDLDDEDMCARAEENIRDAFRDPECVDEILIEDAPEAAYEDIPDFLKGYGEDEDE